jgi:hypothetical protein
MLSTLSSKPHRTGPVAHAQGSGEATRLYLMSVELRASLTPPYPERQPTSSRYKAMALHGLRKLFTAGSRGPATHVEHRYDSKNGGSWAGGGSAPWGMLAVES